MLSQSLYPTVAPKLFPFHKCIIIWENYYQSPWKKTGKIIIVCYCHSVIDSFSLWTWSRLRTLGSRYEKCLKSANVEKGLWPLFKECPHSATDPWFFSDDTSWIVPLLAASLVCLQGCHVLLTTSVTLWVKHISLSFWPSCLLWTCILLASDLVAASPLLFQGPMTAIAVSESLLLLALLKEGATTELFSTATAFLTSAFLKTLVMA